MKSPREVPSQKAIVIFENIAFLLPGKVEVLSENMNSNADGLVCRASEEGYFSLLRPIRSRTDMLIAAITVISILLADG